MPLFRDMALVFFMHVVGVSSLMAAPAAILVTSISPVPNYAGTGDINMSVKLSDGVVAKSHMWGKAGAVSWRQAPPIAIDVQLASEFTGRPGTLGIHTSNKPAVGVAAPIRIDVYGIDSNETVEYLGGQDFTAKHAMGESFWQEVDLSNISDRMRVVIHSGGKVTTMDEIRLVAGYRASPRNLRQYVSDPIADSYSRLVSSVNFGIPKAKAETKGISVRYFDFIAEETYRKSTAINFDSIAGEPVYLGVEVRNTYRDNRCVNVATDIKHLLYKIETIHSVRGKAIDDPIMPLHSCVEVNGNTTARFLVKMLDYGEGSRQLEADITVSGNGEVIDKQPVVISLAGFLQQAPEACLSVNVWSYSIDKPIWSEPNVALDFMRNNGIDVFIIAPGQLPRFPLERIESGYKGLKRFQQALSLYDNVEKLLVFAALDSSVNKYSSDKKLKAALTRWLDVVKSAVEASGRDAYDWYLYPIDEPRGKKMDQLLRIAQLVDEIDAKVKIYANPLRGKKGLSALRQRAQLNGLQNYIDVWQPEYQFFASNRKASYVGDKAKLWMYENPGYPAKEESKRFYYGLPLKAIANGATGVGFWAGSVTDGSSAWVDIDGRRPDWSVFYESDSGPVSSLRWEAFAKGLKDACIYQRLSISEGKEGLTAFDAAIVERKHKKFHETVRQRLMP